MKRLLGVAAFATCLGMGLSLEARQCWVQYTYIFPPPGQAGPPQRSCYKWVFLEPIITELSDLDVDYNITLPPLRQVAPEPVIGSASGSYIWMVNDRLLPGSEVPDGSDQGDLQVYNPLAESITAVAIGVPALSEALPIQGGVDPNLNQDPIEGWHTAIISREQWNANAWDSLAVGDAGNPADEVLPTTAPIDWTPVDTGTSGTSFEDLFNSDTDIENVILYWTAKQEFGIQPGKTRPGFVLGATGQVISDRELPFVTFGTSGIQQGGTINVIPEPASAVLLLATLSAVLLVRRRSSFLSRDT